MNIRRTFRFVAAAIFLSAGARCRAQNPQGAAHPGNAAAQAPALSPQQIPDIATLMHDVLENQDQIDKIRENYACRDTREEDTLGKHGRIKKKTTYVYQVSFLGSNEIDRLIEKDSKPLSDHAQTKEDARIRKEVEKYEKDQAAEASGKKKKKDQAAIAIQDFLRADRFFNPRRELFAGQEVIVFDFERNPAFKAKTLAQKLAQALVGTIWIDARAHDVVRLEAHFAKNVKIGGGLLAALHKGSTVAFAQTFIHNQVWLPTYTEIHISARALLFASINENETDRYSDYKEFHVHTNSIIAPPAKPKP